MNKNSIVFAIAGILLIGGIGYIAMQNKPQPSDTMVDKTTGTAMIKDEDSDEKEDADTDEDEDDKEAMETSNTVQIEGSNFKYSKTEIRVKKGDTVKIVFKNTEGFHDWVIDEFDAKTKQIKAGESETIQFIADTAGTFEYYCSVGDHRAKGMVGSLIVEE